MTGARRKSYGVHETEPPKKTDMTRRRSISLPNEKLEETHKQVYGDRVNPVKLVGKLMLGVECPLGVGRMGQKKYREYDMI